MINAPPPMSPNEIQAMYMQMVNTGQNAVPQLLGPYLSLGEWRERELKRWKERNHG